MRRARGLRGDYDKMISNNHGCKNRLTVAWRSSGVKGLIGRLIGLIGVYMD